MNRELKKVMRYSMQITEDIQWVPLLKYITLRIACGLCFCLVLAQVVHGDSTAAAAPDQAQIFSGESPIPHDPWFWVLAAWWVFSAFVSGMPEPTRSSSPWYITCYRSFHIISASGTAYFQNKLHWPSEPGAPISGGPDTPPPVPASISAGGTPRA